MGGTHLPELIATRLIGSRIEHDPAGFESAQNLCPGLYIVFADAAGEGQGIQAT
jgi:hypothetical protein